jgi:hypothetical protein
VYRYVDTGLGLRLVQELRTAADELARARLAVGATASLLTVTAQRRIAEAAEWAAATAADLQRRLALLSPPDLLPLSRPQVSSPSGHDAWYRLLVPAYLRSGEVAARFVVAGLAPARTGDAHDPVLALAPAWRDRRVRLAALREARLRQDAALEARAATGRYTAAALRRLRRERAHDDVLLARAGRLTGHQVTAILAALTPAERRVALDALAAWARDLDRSELDAVDRELLRAALAAVRACHVDAATVAALEFPRAPHPFERLTATAEGVVLGPLAPEGYREPPEVRAARDRGTFLGGRVADLAGGAGLRAATGVVAAGADGDWSEVAWQVAGGVPLSRVLPARWPVDPALVDDLRDAVVEVHAARRRPGAPRAPADGAAAADPRSCLSPHAGASADLEDEAATLQPAAQDGTERDGRGEDAVPVG